ncbi:uncharacterized protein LOC127702148 [Mytilus californianus]|uniref:uncharacterized protein LOC127702148 n=1 Tax=Mytilus californianus TaxID=6549 RepID=UPI002247A6E6|nr:uncharacterized protein LOC127702148 [Mytilus californianus]
MTSKAARWLICFVFISICIIRLERKQLRLQEMLTRLFEMTKPTVNDNIQNRYCSYIMQVLSYFSGERCMVAGSSREQTRLRIRQDEGDYDFLMISAISIPVSALEYREDLPCFVHIKGLQLVDQFPTVQLIDGRYLPSNLLSEIRPEAFKHIRNFHKLLSHFGRTRCRNSLHVVLDHNIKPGKTLVSYSDVDCPALDNKHVKRSREADIKNKKKFGDKTNGEEIEKPDVILKYKSKSSKHFIPVFPLAGRPRFLDEWKQRKRVWPPEHVVDDILNSEFFVVAKPALIKRERKKDFCLAYNNGEIKLARAMTIVQKKVVLILKAIEKSVLQDYSEVLTTFHWKTAVYWNSETLNSLLLEDTEDNVFKLLIKVLDYMINCLRNTELQHFFIPSNLFAGMDKNTSIEIANKITEIREHPIKALNVFFAEQTFDEMKYEKIPAEKVAEFRKAYNDPCKSSKIIVAILKIFSSESKEKVRAALHDVLTDELPFFIEEMARRRDKSQVDSSLEQLILSNQIRKESFTDMVVDHLLDKVRKKEVNDENIAKIFTTLMLQKVLNQ